MDSGYRPGPEIELHDKLYDEKVAEENTHNRGPNSDAWLKKARCHLEKIPYAQAFFRIADARPSRPTQVQQINAAMIPRGARASLQVINLDMHIYIYTWVYI